MLRILDRHVLREFSLHLLLGMAAFAGIYLVVDLFEKIDVFVDHHAAAGLVLSYYLYSLPLILVEVLPIAMLLATILALGTLHRSNEITAMQSCGLSPLRITLPLLILGAVASLTAFAVGEEVVPGAYQRQRETLEVRIKQKRSPDAMDRSDIHYMGRGGRVYVARAYEPKPPTLTELSMQQFRSDPESGRQQMWKRADALLARWDRDQIWKLEDGYLRLFTRDAESVAAFRRYGDSRWDERPDEFTRTESDPFHMSRRDLHDYIRRIREGGARVQQQLVDYHLRGAFPLANLVMVLLGSCLSLRIRRGTLALGVGVSIFLGFAYYGFLRVGQALGYTGHLDPLLSAWLGNIVFGVAGGVLFWRLNR